MIHVQGNCVRFYCVHFYSNIDVSRVWKTYVTPFLSFFSGTSMSFEGLLHHMYERTYRLQSATQGAMTLTPCCQNGKPNNPLALTPGKYLHQLFGSSTQPQERTSGSNVTWCLPTSAPCFAVSRTTFNAHSLTAAWCAMSGPIPLPQVAPLRGDTTVETTGCRCPSYQSYSTTHCLTDVTASSWAIDYRIRSSASIERRHPPALCSPLVLVRAMVPSRAWSARRNWTPRNMCFCAAHAFNHCALALWAPLPMIINKNFPVITLRWF